MFKLTELVEVGSGDIVVVATAKIEIRRGPNSISPQVDGSDSETYLFLLSSGEEKVWI
jgi:hypothetical protein